MKKGLIGMVLGFEFWLPLEIMCTVILCFVKAKRLFGQVFFFKCGEMGDCLIDTYMWVHKVRVSNTKAQQSGNKHLGPIWNGVCRPT